MRIVELLQPTPPRLTHAGFCGLTPTEALCFIDETMKCLRVIGQKLGVAATLVDAERIAGVRHIVHASNSAVRAFSRHSNVASSPEVEFLIYAAAEHQISKAIAKIGIAGQSKRAVLVVMGPSREAVRKAISLIVKKLQCSEDDTLLDLTPDRAEGLIQVYRITRGEILSRRHRFGSRAEAVADCVLERVALVNIPT